MIKEKDLNEIRVLRYQDNSGLTFQTLQNFFRDSANSYGIDVAFYIDEIKHGGLIGGSTEQCLVLHHPSHRNDYMKFALTIKLQGTYAFVRVYSLGESVQLGNNYLHDNFKNDMKQAWGSEAGGAAVAGALLGRAARRIIKGGANKQKLEEEQMWYSIINDIFNEIM